MKKHNGTNTEAGKKLLWFTTREEALLKQLPKNVALPMRLKDWRLWTQDSVIYINELSDFVVEFTQKVIRNYKHCSKVLEMAVTKNELDADHSGDEMETYLVMSYGENAKKDYIKEAIRRAVKDVRPEWEPD